ADFVGDSLELSFKAKETNADVILFCGVKFMAETAKIISPDKTVIMPDPDAGCPMACMITAQDVISLKEKYPNHEVVCYVNSTADVKAESDICCTSSNAVKVVESISKNKGIIFIPDVNLGTYVKNKLKRENFILWPGYCLVHAFVTAEEVMELKKKHPLASVIVHPECKIEVIELADHILSTSGMVRKIAELKDKEFIVVTEQGIVYPLKNRYPDRKFYYLSKMTCVNMKKNTIEMVEESLENMRYEIKVKEQIIVKAKKALDRMLQLK
ncbi:MAG: quinolinate synthase NadA, partial [Proteobacteria bacterium]|nr:quinolinate synthase NadA [Pseudomonadota bacterium]